MNPVETIINPYIRLECDIRELMSRLFSSTCGLCTACCCRADICEETTQSAFLSLLLNKQGRSAETMDDRYGWLDIHGCALEYGRPPVCYAFFCDELLARLPDEETRWVVRILGRLINYIGESAVGDTHLVELQTLEDLEAADLAGITTRLEEAQAVLEIVEEYVENGHLGAAERDILGKIPLDEL